MAAETVKIEGKCYPGESFSARVPVDVKRLDLSNKMLVDIDLDAIGSLRSLEVLDLSVNDFHGINVDLRKLEACPLRVIDLHGDITLASDEPCVYELTLGKFPALENLDLYQNALHKLDLSPLSKSDDMHLLDVSWNHLSGLATSPLGDCEGLEELSLEANRLEAISPAICRLERLRTMKLSLNKLVSLPDCLGNMTSLKRLEISRNPINHLPESFSLLHNLEVLKIADLPLAYLPSSVLNLSSIKVFDAGNFVKGKLQRDILTRIIDSIAKVQYLDLVANMLAEVPEQLRPFSRLTHLDLGSNEIASLPSWFDTFSELKVLGLNDYKGDEFPEAILGLTRLKHLKMAGATCNFPDGLLDLPALDHVAVSAERLDEPVMKRMADKGIHVYAPYFPHGHFGRMNGALWELDSC